MADNSTLRSVRSIFGDVHAAAENDCSLFRGCGRETLRGFFYRLIPRLKGGGFSCRAGYFGAVGAEGYVPVPVRAQQEDAVILAELHHLVVRVAVGIIQPAARDG